MRWMILTLTLILALGTGVIADCGQCPGDADDANCSAWGGAHPRGEGGQPPRRGGIAEVLGEMDLTEEQMTQVREILDSHRETMAAFFEENREAMTTLRERMEELRNAEEPDPEAMRALREEMGELMMSGRELGQALADDLGEVLTEEQLEAVMAAMPPARGPGGRGEHGSWGGRERGEDRPRPHAEPGGMAVAMLNHILTDDLALTDDQQAQIETLVQDAMAQDAGRREGLGRLARQIHDDVLTADQRELVDAYKDAMIDGAVVRHLDLTEEQGTQLRELAREVWGQLENAETGEARMAVLAAAREASEEILTPPQVQQLRMSRQMAREMESFMMLDLSEEQHRLAEELRRETGDALRDADTAQERLDVLREAIAAFRSDILTDEQRAMLDSDN